MLLERSSGFSTKNLRLASSGYARKIREIKIDARDMLLSHTRLRMDVHTSKSRWILSPKSAYSYFATFSSRFIALYHFVIGKGMTETEAMTKYCPIW